jgi:predicted thioesterase
MMTDELKPGIKTTLEEVVTIELTAPSIGSGGLMVYATPAMIRLMEHASWSSVEGCMQEGYSTVGTSMNVRHISASPVGAHIRCECELSEVDGRRLVFKVAAYDESGLVGVGVHERYIVNTDRFMAKAAGKL